MAHLVGDDVEIQAEELTIAVHDVGAKLHEAVSCGGVVQGAQENDLQSIIVGQEMPADGSAEIVLPNVQDESSHAIGVGCLEFSCSDWDMVEMTVSVGQRRRTNGAIPGRVDRERTSRRGLERGP